MDRGVFLVHLQPAHGGEEWTDGRRLQGEPRDARLRRRAAWLARVNALLGIAALLAAVRLARGG